MMHGTSDFPLLVELDLVTNLVGSGLVEFLKFVYGIWLYLVVF